MSQPLRESTPVLGQDGSVGGTPPVGHRLSCSAETPLEATPTLSCSFCWMESHSPTIDMLQVRAEVAKSARKSTHGAMSAISLPLSCRTSFSESQTSLTCYEHCFGKTEGSNMTRIPNMSTTTITVIKSNPPLPTNI